MFTFEHFILCPTGAPAFLPPDFFLLLLSLALCAEFPLFQFIAKIASREKTVGTLQTGGLTFDLDAGWRMTKLYAGRRFINLLTAGSGSADKAFR